jgi:hypothetical protein
MLKFRSALLRLPVFPRVRSAQTYSHEWAPGPADFRIGDFLWEGGAGCMPCASSTDPVDFARHFPDAWKVRHKECAFAHSLCSGRYRR